MIHRKAIEKYAAEVAREFRPEKIILFGSHAYGRPNADSDVDLMVLMKKRTPNTSTKIRRRLGYAGFPMDLLVWTPERLCEWAEAGDGFARDVLERGQVLYEQDHA